MTICVIMYQEVNMKNLILILGLLTFYSCKQTELTSLEGVLAKSAPTSVSNGDQAVEENLYAISTTQNELGFNIAVNCSNGACSISGKIYNYSGMEKTNGVTFIDSVSNLTVSGNLNLNQQSGLYTGTLRTNDYFRTNDTTGLNLNVVYNDNSKTLSIEVKPESSYSAPSRCIQNTSTISKNDFDYHMNNLTQTLWVNFFESDMSAPLWTECNF